MSDAKELILEDALTVAIENEREIIKLNRYLKIMSAVIIFLVIALGVALVI